MSDQTKAPILYKGSTQERGMGFTKTKVPCDCCGVSVWVVTKSFGETKEMAVRTGRSQDVLCETCFDQDARKDDAILVVPVWSLLANKLGIELEC